MHNHQLRRLILAAAAPVIVFGAALLAPGAAPAAFPGANGEIAYSHQVGNAAAIYVVGPNGGTPTNLSAVGAGSTRTADFQAAWSADGKQLAFVRVDFAHCSGQIWTMNADGTGQTNVSSDAATANEFNPAYGPDGSIAFVRAAPGTFNICTSGAPANRGTLWVRSPSGTLHQLTTAGTDSTPAFSPDGSKIAFTRTIAGGPHIFVMNANGSGTPTDLGPGVKPNWSPDGSKITFAAPGVPNGPTGGPVMTMNSDGRNRQTLNVNGTAPAWSPDGTEIAYIAIDPSTHATVIGVMSATGQNQHNITSPGPGNNDVKPDWQPILRPLRLKVHPHRSLARRRTCFRFRAKSGGSPVAHIRIVFARHHKFTSRRGRARFCVALHAGRYRARASKPGYRRVSVRVRIRRR